MFAGAKGGSSSFKQTPDNLRSNDTFEAVLGLCVGPIKGPVRGLKSIKLDGTPIENETGELNYQNFAAPFADGDPLKFPQRVNLKLGAGASPVQVGLTLTNAGGSNPVWATRTLTNRNADYVDMRFVAQQLFSQTAKGIFDATATIEIQMKPVGSTTWINPTLTNSSQSTYQEQGLVSSVGRIYLPRSLYDDNGYAKVGNQNYAITGKTNSPAVYELRISLPNEGAYANTAWDIRARLLERDSYTGGKDNTDQEKRTISWESMAAVYSGVMGEHEDWRGLAWLQLYGKASDQLTGVPEVTGVYDTKIVSVPTSNIYNPDTRQYISGVWDGSWTKAFTTDPAWIISDAISDELSGISLIAPGSYLNKWDALDLSKWCSELVPDGNGGTHPRYNLNLSTSTPQKAEEFIRYLAGAVGALAWDQGDGEWRVKVDKADAPSDIFTLDNIEGEFSYSHTDVDTRFNDIVGKFKNEEMDYREDGVQLYDNTSIANIGRKPTTIALVGCTNRQEAMRRVKLRLRSTVNETRVVTFTTNRRGRNIEQLSTILIADGDLGELEKRTTGRTVAVAADRKSIIVRDPMYIAPGVAYKMWFTIPNPDYSPETATQPTTSNWTKPTISLTRSVINSSTQRGAVTTIYLSEALPATIADNLSVALEATNLPTMPRLFRVTGVELQPDGERVAISAINIDTEKWSASDNVSKQDTVFQDLRGAVTPPTLVPGAPLLSLYRVPIEQGSQVNLQASWVRPTGAFNSGFRVQYSINGGALQTAVERQQTSTWELANAGPGNYHVEICTIDRRGGYSQPLIGDLVVDQSLIDATQVKYSGGETLEERKPAEKGANITETHKSADTGAVSGRPATQIISDADAARAALVDSTGKLYKISDIVGNVTDLQNTYGNTVSSKASADAAKAAQTASETASTNAATARDASQAARDAANSAATTAGSAKTGAETARDQAGIARDQAGNANTQAQQQANDARISATSASGYASTASGSATIATQKADAAGSSATNAKASEDSARTQAGYASTSATQAATSETNAAGSKNAAATSATVSASSANDAAGAALTNNASPAAAPGLWYTTWGNFAPASTVPTELLSKMLVSNPTRYALVNGRLRVSNNAQAYVTPSKPTPFVKGRRYRYRGAMRAVAAGDSFEGLIVGFDKDGNSLGYSYFSGAALTTAADTVFEFTFSSDAMAYPASLTLLGGYDQTNRDKIAYFLPTIIARGSGNNNTAVTEIISMNVVDVESEIAAAASASASATSASLASTKADAAGVSATSSQTSATNASTSAGQAQTFATSASTSATNAGTSANTASTQAGVAASSATSATAAALASLPQSFDPIGWMDGVVYGDDPRTYPAATGLTKSGTGWLVDGAHEISSRWIVPVTPGNTYQVTLDYDAVSGSAATSSGVGGRLFVNNRNANGIYVGGQPAVVFNPLAGGQIVNTVTPSAGVYSYNVYIIADADNHNANVKMLLKKISVVDVTARNAAQTAATAAAGSASTASTKADQAGQSATAASASATSAQTDAGKASTSATQASTSATNALGSQNSAASSATVAASTRDTAINTVASQFPATVDSVGTGYTPSPYGTLSGAPLYPAAAITNSGGRYGIAIANYGNTYGYTQQLVAGDTGRIYEVTAELEWTSTPSSGDIATALAALSFDGSFNLLSDDRPPVIAGYSRTLGIYRVTGRFAKVADAINGITAWNPSAKYVRFGTQAYSNASPFTYRLLGLAVRDITSQIAAKGSADASATSASSAAASNTAAGQSASAAKTSETNANTSAGSASTFATNASTSATNAAGSATNAQTSASSASTSAGVAASSAKTAQTSANFPMNFSQKGALYVSGSWGAGAALADGDFITGPSGFAYSKSGYFYVSYARPIVGKRRLLRYQARLRAVGADGNYSPDYEYSNSGTGAEGGTYSGFTALPVSAGWVTIDYLIDNRNSDTIYFWPQLRGNAGNGGTVQVDYFRVTDVTDQQAAADSATAAATSASTASTKADAAGTSATAANQSRIDAQAANGSAQTYATNANTSAVNASASASAAQASALISSSYSAASTNLNDKFALWTDPAAYPSSWQTWTSGGNYRIQRQTGRGSPYSIRTLNDNVNVNSGFYQSVPIFPGKWVVEVVAELEGGSWYGGGAYVDESGSDINFATLKDDAGNVGPNVTGVRSWTKLVTLTRTGMTNLYGMVGWPDGFGQTEAKYMRWYKLALRPATSMEINANKALADSTTNTATIASLSQTVATANTTLATRADTLEAKAAVTAPSYIVKARGNSATSAEDPGLFNGKGERIGILPTRSYMVYVWNGNGNWFSKGYDVYGSTQDRTDMTNLLNVISTGQIIVITTHDEPNNGHLDPALRAAMERCGAGLKYSSPNFKNRGAYILISTAGIGYGGGSEYYAGSTNDASDATIKRSFSIIGDVLAGASSDGAAVAAVTARVSTVEGVAATAAGRTEAFFTKEVTAGGGSAFISARAKDDNGNYTSDVSLGGTSIMLYNQTSGGYKLAMQLSGGNALFTGSLNVGAMIRLGSGAGWPVALRQQDFQVADGGYIDFGTDLGVPPDFTFSQSNFAVLNSGETYSVTVDNPTSTGATLRAKILTPATSQSVTLNNPSSPGSGPASQQEKGSNPDASDGTYNLGIYFSGTAYYYNATQ
jgi:predicted phage tail protein